MGSATSVPSSTRVVVVGGGYCGVTAAQKLDGATDVTLVSEKEVLVNKLSTLRSMTDELYERRSLIPLDRALQRGKVVTAAVTGHSAQDKTVTLSDGQVLPYDKLIIATGAKGAFPSQPPADARSADDLHAAYRASREAVSAAEAVLIVGGGTVGVELAGEIKAAHPSKAVTLVHSGSSLLSSTQPPLKPAFVTRLTQRLEGLGVVVRLGERSAVVCGPGELFLRQQVDGVDTVVFTCLGNGGGGNSAPFETLPKDDNGFLRVDPSLQVEGHADVYAVGDCNNWPEAKMLALAANQAVLAADNILRGERPQQAYRSFLEGAKWGIAVMPLGPREGLSHIKGIQMGAFFTRKMKGGDLLAGQWAATLRQPLAS